MSSRIQNVQSQEYNGRKFRSTLEAETAKALDAMGIPYEYESRKIELLEGFRSPFQKKKVIGITYTPDFIIGPIMLECKGFETPEWKIKKKLVFKWLQENEPNTIFYQIHDARKQLLEMLDNHLPYLDLAVRVTSKPTKKQEATTTQYSTFKEAMAELGIPFKPIGAILRSLTGKSDYVYGYKWKLINLLKQ